MSNTLPQIEDGPPKGSWVLLHSASQDPATSPLSCKFMGQGAAGEGFELGLTDPQLDLASSGPF
jgi:hypothetical protein